MSFGWGDFMATLHLVVSVAIWAEVRDLREKQYAHEGRLSTVEAEIK